MLFSSSSCSTDIDQSPALQVGRQLLERQPGPALDGAQGNLDDLGDLSLGVAAVVSQLNHLALVRWQTDESLAEGLPLQRLGDVARGARSGAVRRELNTELKLPPLPAGTPPQIVDGSVPDGGQ